MAVYAPGTENPTLDGVVAGEALVRGVQFLIYNDGGVIKIRMADDSEVAHGVVTVALTSGDSLNSENVYVYGRAFTGIAGEALVLTDYGVALIQDDDGRLDKGAGDFWYLPIATARNSAGTAANGDEITYVKRGA